MSTVMLWTGKQQTLYPSHFIRPLSNTSTIARALLRSYMPEISFGSRVDILPPPKKTSSCQKFQQKIKNTFILTCMGVDVSVTVRPALRFG
jgi:hypothetical protein